jgi:heme exporter protein D
MAKKGRLEMTTHTHFLLASYAVFAIAIVIEVMSLVASRRRALNAVDTDSDDS